jgi:hypothetical protein
MINTKTLQIIGLALIGFSGVANAESRYDPEPMIWKTVRAGSGEDAWQACRRHFRNDVTRVKWGPSGTVSCYVPYHYIYGPGQLRQNFNQ